MAFFGLTIAIILGIVLYFSQNKMIYLPNPPMINSQSPETNPGGYRNPGERDLTYNDIYL